MNRGCRRRSSSRASLAAPIGPVLGAVETAVFVEKAAQFHELKRIAHLDRSIALSVIEIFRIENPRTQEFGSRNDGSIPI